MRLPATIVPPAIAIIFAGLRLLIVDLILVRFSFKIDVIGCDLIATDDLGHRTIGLNGTNNPEVMFRMLQIILGQNAITGRRGVACELLIFLKNGLGWAAHFDVLRPIGLEGSVGIMLRLSAI